MLNLSAGEGRDTSAFGTIRIDWSLPLMEAILYALQIGNQGTDQDRDGVGMACQHADYAQPVCWLDARARSIWWQKMDACGE